MKKKALIYLLALAVVLAVAYNIANPSFEAAASVSIPEGSIIQDTAFYEHMIDELGMSSGDEITAADVSGITSVDVSGLGIKDLTGIEHFAALLHLDCSENELTELDMTNNPLLRTLKCASNELTKIDVSNNAELEILACFYNELTALDISNNPLLTELLCSSNAMTELDVKNNPALEYLSCFYNKLTELDVTKNPLLETLICSSNALTELDVSQNLKLTQLACEENKLTELDVANNLALEVLDCSHNELTELDVRKNAQLEKLGCGNNALTTLDVTQNAKLTELYCEENKLTELDVSKNTELVKLTCSKNPFTELDVSNNTKLEELECVENGLTSLDVSNNLVLVRLVFRGNEIGLINITKNIELSYVDSSYNHMQFADDVNGWRDNSKLILGETFIFYPQSKIDFPSTLVEGFVMRLYRTVMERAPDEVGLQGWTNYLTSGEMSGAQVVYGFFFSDEMNEKELAPREFIIRMYNAIMGRSPGDAELAGWIEMYERGAEREDLFYIAIMSDEFGALCDEYDIVRGEYWPPAPNSIEGFVTRAYNLCLGRYPDDTEMQSWVADLRSEQSGGRDIVSGFVNSPEFLQKDLSDRAYIEVLYNVFLGRPTDETGRAQWEGQLDDGATREDVLIGISDSPEFTEICSAYGIKVYVVISAE